VCERQCPPVAVFAGKEESLLFSFFSSPFAENSRKAEYVDQKQAFVDFYWERRLFRPIFNTAKFLTL
jgi:hypothetical protein